MLKFTFSTKDKRPALGLGLSRTNCARLLAGQPIQIRCADVGLPYPLTILLMAGETERTLMETLQKAGFELPTDPAKIHIDPKL